MSKEVIVPGDPEKWTASYSPGIVVKGETYLFISGQVAFDEDGHVVGKGDMVAQARHVFEKIRSILTKAGVDFSSVVKTNYYVTDVSKFPKVADLRSEYFKDNYPASTMVEVKGLVNKDLLIEIEAVAIIP